MARLKRTQFAHYINTNPGAQTTPTWVLEGNGVEALSIVFNAQIDQFKSIVADVADADFNGYQMQSSISGKRIYDDDPVYMYLDSYRKRAQAIETEILEIDMAEGTGTTTITYPSTKYSIMIVFNEFLGDSATISYDIYFKNDPIQGTSVITNGSPVFTETAE